MFFFGGWGEEYPSQCCFSKYHNYFYVRAKGVWRETDPLISIAEGTFKFRDLKTKKSCVTPRPGASVTMVSGSHVNTISIDVYLRR